MTTLANTIKFACCCHAPTHHVELGDLRSGVFSHSSASVIRNEAFATSPKQGETHCSCTSHEHLQIGPCVGKSGSSHGKEDPSQSLPRTQGLWQRLWYGLRDDNQSFEFVADVMTKLDSTRVEFRIRLRRHFHCENTLRIVPTPSRPQYMRAENVTRIPQRRDRMDMLKHNTQVGKWRAW